MLTILKEKKLVGEKLSLITIVSYTELRYSEILQGFEEDVPGSYGETIWWCVGSGSELRFFGCRNVKKEGLQIKVRVCGIIYGQLINHGLECVGSGSSAVLLEAMSRRGVKWIPNVKTVVEHELKQ
ncbi:hypothetical protein Tco_0643654 [Tanacetum coccineum]